MNKSDLLSSLKAKLEANVQSKDWTQEERDFMQSLLNAKIKEIKSHVCDICGKPTTRTVVGKDIYVCNDCAW